MFLVTVEHETDGAWWDDPNGFDTLEEAKRFAAQCHPPEHHETVIWECTPVRADR